MENLMFWVVFTNFLFQVFRFNSNFQLDVCEDKKQFHHKNKIFVSMSFIYQTTK